MSAKGYAGVVRMGFKQGLAYRFHFIIHIFTTPLSLVIYYFLWKAIFEFSKAQTIQGFTFQGMVSYYALNMLVGFLIWTYVDEDLEDKILNGTLTPSLLRPLNYFWAIFYEHMGLNLLSLLLEIAPIIAIAVIFFGLSLPTPINALLSVISVISAIFLNFTIAYITGLTAFWFGNIKGIRRMRRVVVSFLAGSFIPLTFFPAWAQSLSGYLPFQYLRYVPVTIYLGNTTVAGSLKLIAIGIVWAAALYLLSKSMWNIAYKKFAGSGT